MRKVTPFPCSLIFSMCFHRDQYNDYVRHARIKIFSHSHILSRGALYIASGRVRSSIHMDPDNTCDIPMGILPSTYFTNGLSSCQLKWGPLQYVRAKEVQTRL